MNRSNRKGAPVMKSKPTFIDDYIDFQNIPDDEEND